MSDFCFVFDGGSTVRDLADYYGVRVTSHTGIGMPPTDNIATDYAIIDGAAYQRTISRVRVIQLSCVIAYTSQYDLHAKRKAVIAAINRDALDASTFTLRYTGGASGVTLNIPVRYDGGMEMDRAANDPMQPFVIRLAAYDPYWTGATTTAALVSSTACADAYRILERTASGTWRALGGGLNGEVYCATINPYDGCLYVGGAFTTAYDGAGQTSSVTVNGIARWTGSAWVAYAGGISGGATPYVRAIAFLSATDFVVGGLFTTAGTGGGAVAVSNVARYSEGAWHNGSGYFDKGTDDVVYSLAYHAHTGDIWVGGIFDNCINNSSANVANTKFISKYSTVYTRWDTVTGTSGVDGYCYALMFDWDSLTMYAGGTFHDNIGTLTNVHGIAKLTGSVYGAPDAGVWSKMGLGFDPTTSEYQTVMDITQGNDSSIYAGGYFDKADGSTARRVARWNGSQWLPVGSGIGSAAANATERVRSLAVTSAGRVYAACPGVTTAGRVTLVDQIAQYDGSWYSLDCDLPGSSDPRSVVVDADDNLYVGFDTSGNATVPGTTTVNNPGTAIAYPTITIARSGGTSATIQSIRNDTTEQQIIMPYSLLDGETVTINLSPGEKTVTSDWRGSIINYVLPSSDFATWGLAPGSNQISLFVTSVGSPTITAVMTIVARYWSADG